MTPKTELPWIFEEHEKGWDGDASYTIRGVGPFDWVANDAQYYNSAPEKEDAAYIVHACNAYPRMLDALRKDAAVFGIDSAASALLKELGL